MAGYRDLVLDQAGLLAYWPMGEPTWTPAAGLQDFSGRTPTTYGALVGAATAARSGSLLSELEPHPDAGSIDIAGGSAVDGYVGYRELAAALLSGAQRTFEGYARRDGEASIATYFGGGGNNSAIAYAGGAFGILAPRFTFRPSNSGPWFFWEDALPPLGTPYRWRVVYADGSDAAELYINGVSEGVRVSAGTWGASDAFFRIGMWYSTANQYGWDGALAEMAVYDGLLPARQEHQAYRVGAGLEVYRPEEFGLLDFIPVAGLPATLAGSLSLGPSGRTFDLGAAVARGGVRTADATLQGALKDRPDLFTWAEV